VDKSGTFGKLIRGAALSRVVMVAVLASTIPSTVAFNTIVVEAASCPSYQEYHWGLQWTSTTSAFYHYPDSGFRNPYYGWVGVDGEIIFPNHVPDLGSSGDCAHSLGSLGTSFSEGSWIQSGWYTGCFVLANPPVCRYITLGAYGENYNTGTGVYHAYDIAYVAPSTPIIFQVSYNSTQHCWNAYWQYNVLTGQNCIASSGLEWVGSEAHTHVAGTIVESPLTTYGNSNPNTDNGLRIKGGAGWVNWTTSPYGHLSSQYDESNGATNGCNFTCTVYYYLNELHPDYNLQTHGQNTG
jgi:hypothetical protein